MRQLHDRVRAFIGRRLPERRLFIRSDDHTRFVRLGPGVQFAIWSGLFLFIGWTGTASVVLLVDSVGDSNIRAQAERGLYVYQDRVDALTVERDARRVEAAALDEQVEAILEQVSAMQDQLLEGETRRLELEQTFSAVQGTLRRALAERDDARADLAALAPMSDEPEPELEPVLSIMTAALAETAAERDRVAAEAKEAVRVASDRELELRLLAERNETIFAQLEDALAISVEPLDEMFRAAGLDPQDLVGDAVADHVAPVISVSTMGSTPADDPSLRANRILDRLDELDHYAQAVQNVPLAMPVQAAFRYTSPFGPRWGRMHEGVDLAGPVGTPVYATADGVVTFAGWQNGYGRIVIVRHAYGLETRYPHLNAIRAEVGQEVSRGDQVGDMGSSGRSTGSHLHYEIRVGGEPVNPMTFIRAGQDLL